MASVISEPPAFSPAGNPMYIVLSSTAERLYLRVNVRTSYGNTTETILMEKVCDPDDRASFRIDHVLRSFLDNRLPNIAVNGIHADSYTVTGYTLGYGTDGENFTDLPEKFCMKAAFSHQAFPNRGAALLPISGQLLTYRPLDRPVYFGQAHWLYYWHASGAADSNQTVSTQVRYTDGTTFDAPDKNMAVLDPWRVYRIPVGDDLNDYRQYEPTKTIDRVTITVNGTETVVLRLKELPPFGRTYLFFNSLGGLETMTGTGYRNKSLQVERDSYRRHQFQGYAASDPMITQRLTLSEKFRGNTGWMTEADFAWAQELLTSEKVWIQEDGLFLPITIEGESFALEGDREHQKQISFDYRYAFDRISI